MADCGSGNLQPYCLVLHVCDHPSIRRPPRRPRTGGYVDCKQRDSRVRLRADAGHGERVRDTVRASVWGEKVSYVGDLSAEVVGCSVFVLCGYVAVVFLRHAGAEGAGAGGGRSQLKNSVIAWVNFVALIVHVLLSWLIVYRFQLGIIATALTLNFSWFVIFFGLFGYTVCGGCPLTWPGFSMEAFSGLWDFFKLSVSSGVMLCLENWYYRILIVMTGNLENAKIAVDALSICMNINGWELMIPLGFFAGTGVRVANELGAGNGKGAKFAAFVSVSHSMIIGLFFWLLILTFDNKLALIFSSSQTVLEAVHDLSFLLAFTVLLNSIQPILSGVAVGSGWQAYVAYINLGCYYLVGVPLGIMMEWVFHQGVKGIWAGMIFGGTAVQTIILCIITIRCDWEKEAQKANKHVNKWESVGHSAS
nr:protein DETOXIFICATION 27-like [Ipomoea batatas]